MHVYVPVLVVSIELLQILVNSLLSEEDSALTSKYASVAITTNVLSRSIGDGDVNVSLTRRIHSLKCIRALGISLDLGDIVLRQIEEKRMT